MGAMVVVVWVAMMAAAARGQTQSCVQELIPCGPYVNNATAKPPETCCGPLRNTVKNELPCLCAVYKTPELLKVFNISLDKAVELSHRCGITSNLSACNTGNLSLPSVALNPRYFFYRSPDHGVLLVPVNRDAGRRPVIVIGRGKRVGFGSLWFPWRPPVSPLFSPLISFRCPSPPRKVFSLSCIAPGSRQAF